MKIQKNRAIYIGLLTIVWACAYVYIFNEKIDINGDNCRVLYFASCSRFWTRLCRYIGSPPLTPPMPFPRDILY